MTSERNSTKRAITWQREYRPVVPDRVLESRILHGILRFCDRQVQKTFLRKGFRNHFVTFAEYTMVTCTENPTIRWMQSLN
jgi:hypothetical protein